MCDEQSNGLLSGCSKTTFCTRRLIIFVALVVFTAIFIMIYSVDLTVVWVTWRRGDAGDFTSSFSHGFLVFSESCQIPDVDPYHPTVKNFVSMTNPLNCAATYAPITVTKGDTLQVQLHLLPKSVTPSSYSCCYRGLYRDSDGQSDNGIRLDKDCIKIEKQATIDDEFIKVECSTNGSVFYTNFHSFIHDKADVEERCYNGSRRSLLRDQQYSVLIIGVDAMSRLNMHRQLKKTVQFLKEEMEAVEMYGFNKVGDNTFPNLVPLLTGFDERELSQVCRNEKDAMDNCTFIWELFADRGYRTLYAEDAPKISSFNYLKKGFLKQPTDYYFHNFILAYETALGRDKPLNCYKCVGSVSETEAVLSWLHKFVVNFRERPFFAFSWINTLTHDFLNMGSSGDHMYEDFFRTLQSGEHLANTIIVLLSDHGMRWGSIRKTHIGRLEERLPMLMVAFPPSFASDYPQAVKTFKRNAHRLITPFDLYATLAHLLDFDGRPSPLNVSAVPAQILTKFRRRALSLFQPIPHNRTCDDASIDETWCTCQRTKPINTDDSEVQHISNFLVESINRFLLPYNVCANLLLSGITNARLYAPGTHLQAEEAYNIYDYFVVVRTVPGNATFEGTVRFVPEKHSHELLGSISRLNLYGEQSWCVKDAVARKYCYCKQQKKLWHYETNSALS